ncbi:MAG: glycosyltransferase family 2 protein, partial [Lachnospiraceae bacterium]|nr:glycosyltransferase family 2 protein [Lachnospiraceae bacterium]
MNIDAIHKSGKKLISFVIPCYHSEGSVGLVIEEIRQVVSQRPDFTYQIIAVNDCSPDNLLSVIRREAEKDPQVIAIDLAKNGGRHNALICGCHYADGDYIVFIDDDQQCPTDRLWDLMDPLLNSDADVAIAKYPHKT